MKKISKQYSSGFTLIELLVVIAIIGILATIILAALGSSRSSGADAKVKSQITSMRSQAQLYNGTGSSTGGMQLGMGTVASATNLFGDTASTNSLANLINSLPSGTRYVYSALSGLPITGVQWLFAADLSDTKTVVCIDYDGTVYQRTGSIAITSPSTLATAFEALYPNWAANSCK